MGGEEARQCQYLTHYIWEFFQRAPLSLPDQENGVETTTRHMGDDRLTLGTESCIFQVTILTFRNFGSTETEDPFVDESTVENFAE